MPIEIPFYKGHAKKKRPAFNHDMLAAAWIQGTRENREDHHLLVHGRNPRSPIFMAVCDGLGGHPHGDVSSAAAIDSLAKNYKLVLGAKSEEEIRQNLHQMVGMANVDALEKIKNLKKDGGTTVIAAAVKNSRAHLLYAGDSRAYLITKNGIKQLTQDHHEKIGWRTVLGNFIGAKGLKPWFQQQAPLKIPRGGILLLCSDGLSNTVSAERMQEIANEHWKAGEIANHLVEEAERNGAYDEATAVVFVNRKFMGGRQIRL